MRLKVNWNDHANKYLWPFYDEKDKIEKDIFWGSLESGKATHESVIKAFQPYGIFNEAGGLTIPIINESDSCIIYQTCKNISANLAQIVTNKEILNEITVEFGFRNDYQCLVILYHEIMWDIMNELENKNIVSTPGILIENSNANERNVADLIFIVKK